MVDYSQEGKKVTTGAAAQETLADKDFDNEDTSGEENG